MKKILFYITLIFLFRVEAQSATLLVADSLYKTGNYAKAINYYAQVGSEKASLKIAKSYNSLGNYGKAILQYENIVASNKHYQIARFELGKLYLKTKRFEEGSQMFTSLIHDDANNPEYLYYQGEAFRELDQPENYVLAYQKAVAIDSTHLKSIFQLAKHFVAKQETQQALKYLDLGLLSFADDVSLINLKALALFNNNQYAEAISFFERLLELGERKPYIYGKLAHCYFKEWEFEKAIEVYHNLILMNENDPDPYFNLAQVFLRDKQVDSAKFYLNKSIEVQEPSFYREYRSFANIARNQDDLETALKYYKLAYEEASSDYMCYYQICTIADQLYKDPKIKLQYYENFIKKFGQEVMYFSEMVKKRISELKQKLHFAKK